jgi:DNA-binding beta-propeller fold protein YncE|tara:strand:- start:1478 stop:2671 length:1194 start_codon:yes stop_codon:yes gene_type:complete
MTKAKILVGASLVVALFVLGIGQTKLQEPSTAASNAVMAPHFLVDPLWPKPMGNQWILGNTIGVDVDDRDHIFIVHRTEDSIFRGNTEIGLKGGVSECCTPAPPIIEFDLDGNIVNAWGGAVEGAPYIWPASNHGIEVAPNGDVWIGGNGGGDSHILVFSRDGDYIRTIGMPGEPVDSNSETHFGRVAEIAIDAEANEAYIADGYTHKRVAVVDVATGAFKRYWGAYGNTPDDEADVTYTPGQPGPQQFRGPVHCAEPSNDGLVYVCDRGADRIQVFRKDGTYVREVVISPATLNQGSTWDIAFSPDDEQEFIYLADGQNFKIYVIDRESMDVLYTFGDGGRQPGLFYAPHSIASDSLGNVYTTETYDGKRVQKFVYQGMRAVTQRDRAPTWPADEL